MTLKGKQVLVTGATGFVGGALAERLLADGVQVRALVRDATRARDLEARGASLVVGDLADPAALAQAVAGCAVVFSVGAALRGTALEQYAVNVTGVRYLAEAAHKAGVQRVVHVSTIAAYGYDQPGIISEAMPLQPGAEHYGQSKALGEQVLFERAAALELDVAVIRPGMVYGPHSGFWSGKLFDFAQRRPAFLPGSGNTYCPVIFIDDLVDLLLVVAQHPAASGEVFNAVSDEPVTWRQFIGAYASLAGHQMLWPVPVAVLRGIALLAEPLTRLFREPQPVRGMVDVLFAGRRAYSMNKAARLLDWRPRVGLVEGIARTEPWLRETGRLA